MPIISVKAADTLFPRLSANDVKLDRLDWKWGDQSNQDGLTLLCRLAAEHHPIMEIGTFRGRTTYNMALNTSGRIFTIDLGSAPQGEEALNAEQMNYGAYTPGECFLDAPSTIRDRIELMIGDTANLKLSHLHGQMSMVLVDAGHSYEACLRDTKLAFKLVRPGGIVLWDDYGDYWPGVKRAIDQLATQHTLHHLRRENFVVYRAAA